MQLPARVQREQDRLVVDRARPADPGCGRRRRRGSRSSRPSAPGPRRTPSVQGRRCRRLSSALPVPANADATPTSAVNPLFDAAGFVIAYLQLARRGLRRDVLPGDVRVVHPSPSLGQALPHADDHRARAPSTPCDRTFVDAPAQREVVAAREPRRGRRPRRRAIRSAPSSEPVYANRRSSPVSRSMRGRIGWMSWSSEPARTVSVFGPDDGSPLGFRSEPDPVHAARSARARAAQTARPGAPAVVRLRSIIGEVRALARPVPSGARSGRGNRRSLVGGSSFVLRDRSRYACAFETSVSRASTVCFMLSSASTLKVSIASIVA